MKRFILAAVVAMLVIPASALARTPATGGLKQAIVLPYASSLDLSLAPREIAACFNVYTDRQYALVKRTFARNVCYKILGYPGDGIVKRIGSGSNSYWIVAISWAEFPVTRRGLAKAGVPLSVFDNLTGRIIPAAASARTPVSGGLKQTIVKAAMRGEDRGFNGNGGVFVSAEQRRACFNVWTDDGFAFVSPTTTAHGLCDIRASYGGKVSGWQAVHLILHDTAGRWGLRVSFDLITAHQLRSHGVPVPVYENFTGYKPFPYQNEKAPG